MLKKTELHLGGTPILSDEITYKKNGVNTSPCVEKETFNCNGDTITREYTTDLYGRVTAVSDSVLGNHTYEYDYRGFLVKEDGRTFAYDGSLDMLAYPDVKATQSISAGIFEYNSEGEFLISKTYALYFGFGGQINCAFNVSEFLQRLFD